MRRHRFCISIATSFCLVIVTSCTKTIPTRWWPDESVEIVEGAEYRVELKDGRVIQTDQLARLDSTFVIHTMEKGKGRGIWGMSGEIVGVDGIELHPGEIQSILRPGREELLFGSVQHVRTAHRIRTVAGVKYSVGSFTRTDSTLTIHELYSDGKRREIEPLVLAMRDIESVEAIQMREGLTFLALFTIGMVALIFIGLSTIEFYPG